MPFAQYKFLTFFLQSEVNSKSAGLNSFQCLHDVQKGAIGKFVMNLEQDYTNYKPCGDNEWLLEEWSTIAEYSDCYDLKK